MIDIVDKAQCSGCTACASICPKNCIDMNFDTEGFQYPVVNNDNCINCGVCLGVCPVNGQKKEIPLKTISVFGGQVGDANIRYKSTSGGVFSMLAYAIFEKGGTVYAAGFDKDMHVIHKSARCKDDLRSMRGSKYVQSDLAFIFREIYENLKATDTPILFVGTTCQTEGLYSYIPKKYHERLYIVDLLCYGVPSPRLYNMWIKFLESKYQSRVIDVAFRDKKYGYSGSNVRIEFASGKILEDAWDTKTFPKVMFSHIGLRPICYQCPYKNRIPASDFTLSDMWNIDSIDKTMDDDLGTTKVVVYTQKGMDLLNSIRKKGKLVLIGEYTAQEYLDISKESYKSKKKPSNRDSFFVDAQKMEYPELIEKYLPISKKEKLALVAKPMINRLPFARMFFRLIKKAKIKNIIK